MGPTKMEFYSSSSSRMKYICFFSLFLPFLILYLIYSLSVSHHSISPLPHRNFLRKKEQVGNIWEPRITCNCPKTSSLINPSQITKISLDERSSCSDEATDFGHGQKVISFSLFGDNNTLKNRYNIGHWPNLLAMRKYYSGWVMRIYSDYVLKPEDEYCHFLCENEDVFWCNVTNIPYLGLNATEDLYEMSWRFLAYGDPLVDIMVSRDIDSRLSRREAAAVDEWIKSPQIFHSMRDNPAHNGVPILGGMWGAKTHLIHKTERRNTLRDFVNASSKPFDQGQDQIILRDVLFAPKYEKMLLVHDRLFCGSYWNTTDCVCKPFPTPFDGEHYVAYIYSP